MCSLLVYHSEGALSHVVEEVADEFGDVVVLDAAVGKDDAVGIGDALVLEVASFAVFDEGLLEGGSPEVQHHVEIGVGAADGEVLVAVDLVQGLFHLVVLFFIQVVQFFGMAFV
jgi:hypothetical protein